MKQENKSTQSNHIEAHIGDYSRNIVVGKDISQTIVEGSIDTGGGDFVGGHKVIHGDEIGRDKHVYYNYGPDERQQLDNFLKLAVQAYGNRVRSLLFPVSLTTPYLSLLPFAVRDHQLYFGRERAVDELLQKVLKNKLTVLHGRSGSGKSSLLNAGLGLRLLENYQLLPVFARTYNDPISNIINAIVDSSPDPNRPNLLSKVPLKVALTALSQGIPGVKIVVILDQFEEIFTKTDLDCRRDIIDSIAECLEDEVLPVHVVLGIRREYLGDLDYFLSRLPNILDNRYLLQPMTQKELKQAITGPVYKVGSKITYTDELLNELIHVLTHISMDLTTLQIACTRLYEAAQSANKTQIDLELYQTLGGLGEILTGHINFVLEPFFLKDRKLAWQVLGELIDHTGQRKSATVDDISHAVARRSESTADDVSPVIDKLLAKRLLRVTEHDKEQIELAHDTLASKIHARQSSTEIRQKAALELVVREFDIYRTHGVLMSKDRLRVLDEFREDLPSTPSDVTEFIVHSAMAAEQSTKFWLERADAGLLVSALAFGEEIFGDLISQNIIAGEIATPSENRLEMSSREDTLNHIETKLAELGVEDVNSLAAIRQIRLTGFKTQLLDLRERLRLLEERKSEYVLSSDIPLQIIKEERQISTRIEAIEGKLQDLQTTPGSRSGSQDSYKMPINQNLISEKALITQLLDLRERLRLLEERKSEYVLSSDIPLQIIKEERQISTRIEAIEGKLQDLQTTPGSRSGSQDSYKMPINQNLTSEKTLDPKITNVAGQLQDLQTTSESQPGAQDTFDQVPAIHDVSPNKPLTNISEKTLLRQWNSLKEEQAQYSRSEMPVTLTAQAINLKRQMDRMLDLHDANLVDIFKKQDMLDALTNSLRHRLDSLKNLRRILMERQSEYVLSTDIPLQLIADSREVEQRLSVTEQEGSIQT